MKPTRIRRDIQSPRAGAFRHGPVLGRVSKLRGHEDPGMKRRSRSGGRRGAMTSERRRVMIFWSAALALGTLLVIVGFTMFWLRSRGVEIRAKALPVADDVRVVSRFPSPKEDEALDLVKRALGSRDPASVNSLFRPCSTTSAEVVAYMQGLEARDGRLERTTWLSSMDSDGMLMDGVLVRCEGVKKGPSERIAFLVPDDAGVWKIDFDAFARTSTPSWEDFLEHRSNEIEARVLVAGDSYYNGPFHDEGRWVCYAVFSPEAQKLLPDDQQLLRGYAKAGSPQAKALGEVLKKGGRMGRVTLKIRRMEGADQRQFEITRVMAEDWVLPPTPFDGRFQ